MEVQGAKKWIVIEHQASSLFDLIVDSAFKQTTLGPGVWKTLVDNPSLQNKCNREGFNVESINTAYNYNAFIKVRIGIVANNQDGCNSCDSCIGFGVSLRGCNGLDTIVIRRTTCGNMAICGHFENKDTPAFGYIFVQ